MKLLKQLLDQLRKQPAAYAVTGLGAIGALIIAFGHLTTTEAATLSGAFTALGTIITAALARPVNFTVISGAATVLLQSLVLANVHLSSGEIAAVVGGINFILGIIAVPAVATPVIALRQTRAVDHVGLPSTASAGLRKPAEAAKRSASVLNALSRGIGTEALFIISGLRRAARGVPELTATPPTRRPVLQRRSSSRR